MGENARVVYLGLDAFDVGLATDLMARGELPTLRRLLEEGASVATEAPAGVFVSAQWPTLFTGLDPAHHGYFCWKQFTPGTYDDHLTTPHQVDGRPFWETMSDAGKRVAIIDVPHTSAPEQLNGTMLVEWGCHDRHFGTHSLPEGLVGELNERVGAHPIGTRHTPAPGFDQFAPCDYMRRDGPHRTTDEAAALWGDIVEAHARKRAASLHLLDQGPWDLFMTVFGESHCTGHQLWSVHDTTHPWHSAESAERIGVDPLVEIYRRIDDTVASHLAEVGPDTTVYVNLSHGMGPHYDGTHVLDDVLRRLAAVDRGGWRSRARGAAATALGVAHRRTGGAVDGLLRRALARPGTPPDHGPDPDPAGGDRAGRPWFAIPNNTVSGGIRLNVIGREPRGVLATGADVDTACERLRRGLLELVNVDTGEPVVTAVLRTDGLYERSPDDALPDLFVEWNRNAPIERVWSPRIGLVERRSSHWRTGDHTTGGLLIATGPGIVPGRRAGSVPVVDVGVTLAAAAGVEIPDVDGIPVDFLLPSTTSVAGAAVPTVDGGAPDVSAEAGSAWSTRAAVKQLVRAPASRGARRAWRERTARRASIGQRLASHAAHLTGRLDMLGDAHHMTRARADIALATAEEALRNARLAEQRAAEVAATAETTAAVRAVTSWIENIEVPETTLVTVVMPTHNRAHLLPRAIGSVLRQTYANWELHVVDDGSVDDTQEVLAGYADEPRIRTHRTTGVGAAAARNVALDASGGDVIVYLDDDNVFDPLWFKAVVWAFEQRLDVDVLYGARVIDDIDKVRRIGSGALPVIHLEPWDRACLERANIADMGVLAHRSKLPEGRFDEDLNVHADWDLLLRLTEDHEPLRLPVIALYYFSDSPDRISDGDISDAERVLDKLR